MEIPEAVRVGAANLMMAILMPSMQRAAITIMETGTKEETTMATWPPTSGGVSGYP
jgi:hypothetical protein